ncbi:MAG: hypothetical protein IPJ23_14790 [Ignavibacteriales bacterium]|jgi:uncharacterized low-complexity protein|nr:hypothetical protein [Ignavibacteriales bacterium]
MTNKSLKSILFTGTIVAGSLLSTSTASANPFSFTDLGSGSQLRTALLDNLISQKYNLDLSCGEKTKDNSKSDSKTKDAKCGEGKCGDSKTTEHKCGDGKCGDKSDTTKMHMKDMKKMDSKTKDAKCGEGKCGDSKSTEKKTTDKK